MIGSRSVQSSEWLAICSQVQIVVRRAMKVEALVAAVLLQLAQVGVRKESFVPRTPVTCDCNCLIREPECDWDFLQVAFGLILGFLLSSIFLCCLQSRRPTSTPPSPRRRGHGVHEYPAWPSLGGVLTLFGMSALPCGGFRMECG